MGALPEEQAKAIKASALEAGEPFVRDGGEMVFPAAVVGAIARLPG
jgi:hypothetical protein